MRTEPIQVIEDLRVRAPYEFPVYSCINDLADVGCHAHIWHWHRELQFCIVLQGRVAFCKQTAQYEIGVGEGIFIRPDCIHRSKNLSTPCCRYICLDFSKKLLQLFPGSAVSGYLEQYLSMDALECVRLTRETPWEAEILDRLPEIYRLHQQKEPCYEMLLCAHLFFCVGTLFRGLPDRQTVPAAVPGANEISLRKILTYIESHLDEKILLQDLAAAAHLSKSECCRLFRRSLDCTIFEYILDARIRRSAELLTRTDASISDVALQAGFSSTSYFIKLFHDKFGCTPRQFRQTRQHAISADTQKPEA